MYSAALSTGAALGALISGAMSVSQSWRSFHYLCAALVLATTVLIFFTMPETAYQRDISGTEEQTTADTKEEAANVSQVEHVEESNPPPKKSFTQRMAFTHSPLTNESIWKITFRPVPILLLPPVLWSTVSFGIGIGIFVILGTTAATAFSQVYNFTVWQVGLVWIASIVGNLLGIPFGGYFSDWVANRATSKNGGVREPEMRLPAVSIAMLAYPGSLLLYGLGINYKTHWIVPTLGVFVCKRLFLVCVKGESFADLSTTVSFGSSAAIGISVVYTIDCYRPIAGEVVVSQVVFKCRLSAPSGRFSKTSLLTDGRSSCHHVPYVLLREPMGESGRLCRSVCDHGKLQFRHPGTLDPLIHLGQADPSCHFQMARDATCPLGCGQGDRRVGVSIM
jgi:MFS family permease